ncbi:putative nuclease HARBI1 isoform X2 [Temnothorax longispinosus]|uniref:putative nuclease HARBI1 isoform X2 n=1 Tax=Temnothorax longispinosus TaxID=300112 RepID=UPI003A99AA37
MNRQRLVLILTEFIFSEDSSDNEDMEIIAKVINSIPRKIPRIPTFLQFKSRFRISRETCDFLVDLFEQSEYYSLEGERKGGYKSKTALEHILCFLWFAGNKCVIRSVADLFDMSLSTTHLIIIRVINFLCDIAPSIIKFPQTAEERETNAIQFKEICHIPGIVGCIDGSYISIRTPSHKIRSTYVNRHDETAITLQGICDAQNRFIDVFTGISSKIHDARVYSMSFIREKVCQMGEDYHIIGDAAYPLSTNLITPYKDYGILNETERTFNYSFCKARVKIENTFGILKGRFRQLMHLEMWSVLKMSKFIMACCVLHNLCIVNNDNLEFLEYVEIHDTEPNEYILYPLQQREAGKQKRDRLATKLMEDITLHRVHRDT